VASPHTLHRPRPSKTPSTHPAPRILLPDPRLTQLDDAGGRRGAVTGPGHHVSHSPVPRARARAGACLTNRPLDRPLPRGPAWVGAWRRLRAQALGTHAQPGLQVRLVRPQLLCRLRARAAARTSAAAGAPVRLGLCKPRAGACGAAKNAQTPLNRPCRSLYLLAHNWHTAARHAPA